MNTLRSLGLGTFVALLVLAPTGAYAGSFYGGFYDTGGDVAATLELVGSIDFTAEATQDLTATGDGSYVLTTSGITVQVFDTIDGSLDVLAAGAGLDFVRSAANGPFLIVGVEDEGWVTTYNDADRLVAVIKYDVANTNIATTGAVAYLEWTGNASDATAAGNIKHEAEVKYDGATYDLDGFTWDGGFIGLTQGGNAAGMPEYLMSTMHGPREATIMMGEAASPPKEAADFSTVDASATISTAVALVVGGADPKAFSASSDHYLRIGGSGAYTDIRILTISVYRFQ